MQGRSRRFTLSQYIQGLLWILVGILFLLGISLALGMDGLLWSTEPIFTWKKVYLPIKELLWTQEPLSVPVYFSHAYITGMAAPSSSFVSGIYLGFLCFSLSIFLASLSARGHVLFGTGIGIFILLAYTSHLQHLGMWGSHHPLPNLCIIVPPVLLSIAWHLYHPHGSMGFKILSFMGSWLVSAFLLFQTAEGSESILAPIMSLSHYSYLPCLIGCLIFFVMLGREIIYLIARLSTSRPNPYNGWNFIMLSVICLGNLFFTWKKQGVWEDWSMQHVAVWAWIAIATLAFLWRCLEHRISLWSRLALVLWGWAVLLFHRLNANDMAIEVLEDLFLYAQMGVGLTFFLYILVWLRVPLFEGLPVWKILYRGENLVFVQPFGVVIMAMFFFYSQYLPYYQGLSGFYTGLASTYELQENTHLATQYNKQAISYGKKNHRANYALAYGFLKEDNPERAIRHLKNAIQKNPSPASFLLLSQSQESLGFSHDAYISLKQGQNIFPNATAFSYNLGLWHLQRNQQEKARSYLDQAAEDSEFRELVALNILGFGMPNSYPISAPQTQSYKTNLLAFLLMHPQHPIPSFMSWNENETLHEAYAWNRGLLWTQRQKMDTAAVLYGLPLALHAYKAKKVSQAFRYAKKLQTTESPENKASIFYVLGMWSAEQGAHVQALSFWEKAREHNFQNNYKIPTLDSLSLMGSSQHLNSYIIPSDLEEKTIPELEMLGKKNPFQEELLVQIVLELNKRNARQIAYDIVLEAVELHENSIPLWKSYVLQCLQIGIPNYAKHGLSMLKSLLSPSEYRLFYQTYLKAWKRSREISFS
ncbi:MAG: hypothetical protein OXB93_03520 [Cytophagales bacterium]|nr:hypothetical protein [Cytophagales bacterium]